MREIGKAMDGLKAANDAMIGVLQSKIQKQRNEIGRLMLRVAQLEADKSALRFDLHKARAAIEQARAE